MSTGNLVIFVSIMPITVKVRCRLRSQIYATDFIQLMIDCTLFILTKSKKLLVNLFVLQSYSNNQTISSRKILMLPHHWDKNE